MQVRTKRLSKKLNKHGKKLTAEFREFALKGNVIDLAVGVIIGGAFQSIIKSLIDDMLMPCIGRVLGDMDFTNFFIILSDTSSLDQNQLHSLTYLRDQGAAVFAYGAFLTAVLHFFLMALMVFLVVKVINTIRQRAKPEETPEPTTKKCPFCCTEIALAAIRCPSCCAELAAPIEGDISE